MLATAKTPVIDCRDFDDYCTGHIQGASSLPAIELFARMHELPQRQIPLQLCGTAHHLDIAREWLKHREFVIAKEIVWTDTLKLELAANKLLETGPASRQLWQPSPLLAEFVEHIAPNYPASSRAGVDIACGSGRDMVYLAMQGWTMTGIDYSSDSLERSLHLAQHHHVSINTIQLDLENTGNSAALINQLGTNNIDMVCVFRYLHRPLLPQLPCLLKPGGFIVYQTFMEGCEKMGSPRNPRFLLKTNELATLFGNMDIIRNDICYLADGRPVSAFIARKPL